MRKRGRQRRRRIQRAFRRAHADWMLLSDDPIYSFLRWRIENPCNLDDFDWDAFNEGARERYV